MTRELSNSNNENAESKAKTTATDLRDEVAILKQEASDNKMITDEFIHHLVEKDRIGDAIKIVEDRGNDGTRWTAIHRGYHLDNLADIVPETAEGLELLELVQCQLGADDTPLAISSKIEMIKKQIPNSESNLNNSQDEQASIQKLLQEELENSRRGHTEQIPEQQQLETQESKENSNPTSWKEKIKNASPSSQNLGK